MEEIMRKTLEERFWSKVDKRGPEECWEWTASKAGATVLYGRFYLKQGKSVAAHVYSYRLAKGEIPEGMQVCHTCDNGLCCNPKHLFLGTAQKNIQDMWRKGRAGRGQRMNREDAYTVLKMRFDGKKTLREIAERFHITIPHVSSLCSGRWRPDVYEEFQAARQLRAA
jgi:hypothetical protein